MNIRKLFDYADTMVNEKMELEKDAVTDVSVYTKIKFLSEGRIFYENLQEMLTDLNEQNRLAIIFLLVDESTNYKQLVAELRENISKPFLKINQKQGWEEKLLEALIVTRSIKVLTRLGYTKSDIAEMKTRFSYDTHNTSSNLNRVIKSLYFLCKSLRKKQVAQLISEIDQSLISNEYGKYLELFILYLIQRRLISIRRDRPDLTKLVTVWKRLDSSRDPSFNFDYWEREKNYYMQDSTQISTFQSIKCNNQDDRKNSRKSEIAPWPLDHKRLCIIINEITVKNVKRKGSEIDGENLEKTFFGCGFDVEHYHDFTADDMLKLLNVLSDETYSKYGSIFIFILSHGKKGLIIFSDGKEIPIEDLENKFCCEKLKMKFKFLILQSCQGNDFGSVEENEPLVEKDGLSNCPLVKLHYARFHSTIENFASARDPKRGTWFIEEICKVIEEKKEEIDIEEFIMEVTKRVSERRGRTEDNNKKIVQLPTFQSQMIFKYYIPKYNANNYA